MKKLYLPVSLLATSLLALQLFFLMKIALMAIIAPESTSFQRSEAWRIISKEGALPWRQEWVSHSAMPDSIKQAVIASEDSDFINHHGVEWDAIESAWYKNAKAKAQDAQHNRKLQSKNKNTRSSSKTTTADKPIKIIGGSTITQQLAKNLFLSGERNFTRKVQEFVIAQFLELILSKQQILTIYLNNVEWGEGVFGVEAAAQHYFKKPAKQLSNYESAKLAVMLPRPKFFEKQTNSVYLSTRATTIVARMYDVELPD